MRERDADRFCLGLGRPPRPPRSPAGTPRHRRFPKAARCRRNYIHHDIHRAPAPLSGNDVGRPDKAEGHGHGYSNRRRWCHLPPKRRRPAAAPGGFRRPPSHRRRRQRGLDFPPGRCPWGGVTRTVTAPPPHCPSVPVHPPGPEYPPGLARLKVRRRPWWQSGPAPPRWCSRGCPGGWRCHRRRRYPGKTGGPRGGPPPSGQGPGLGVAVQIFPLGRVGEEHPPGEVQLLMEGGKLLGQQAQADVRPPRLFGAVPLMAWKPSVISFKKLLIGAWGKLIGHRAHLPRFSYSPAPICNWIETVRASPGGRWRPPHLDAVQAF